MAIKDSIVNLKKGLRTTLTNVPALIDTLVRGLDGVAEAAEEENTYSTDEHVVGKWIDGTTDVYEKMIEIESLPNTTAIGYKHNITDLGKIIELNGIADNGSQQITLPLSGSAYIYIIATTEKIFITAATDRTDYSAIIKIRYIKSATNRAPENDIKNDGGEEKNNKEVKNER